MDKIEVGSIVVDEESGNAGTVTELHGMGAYVQFPGQGGPEFVLYDNLSLATDQSPLPK